MRKIKNLTIDSSQLQHPRRSVIDGGGYLRGKQLDDSPLSNLKSFTSNKK